MAKDKRDFSLDTLRTLDAPFWAFFSAFVLGAIGVAVSKGFGWSVLLVVAVPVILMFTYWGASLIIPRLAVRNDQLGDNMYYLGFLLTLVSLTATLIQYNSTSDNNYIISNFGVALVATLIGILARTLHAQMRRDVAGVERELQEQLSQASYRLRGQIGAVSEDFSVLSRQITQITNQYSEDLVNSHKALSGGLVQVVDEQTGALRTSSEENAKRVEASMAKSIADLESATADGSKQLLDSADTVKSSIDEISRSFGEYLQLHTESLKSVQEQEVAQRRSQISELQTAIARLTDAVSQVNSEAITKDQLVRFTDAFETGVLEISEVIQRVSESSENSEQLIKDISSNITGALTESTEQLQDVRNDFKESQEHSSKLEDSIKKLDSRIESTENAIREIGEGASSEREGNQTIDRREEMKPFVPRSLDNPD